MNPRLCSKARDPGGLGPKLTTRFRSAKARFASNSPPTSIPPVFDRVAMRPPTHMPKGSKASDAKMASLNLVRGLTVIGAHAKPLPEPGRQLFSGCAAARL